jgi:hypothetical protein
MPRATRRNTHSPPPSGTHEHGLVPLSCPDCFGVLRFEREGPKGHLLYRCQVDHRYTISSLVHSKEEHLERALWSSVLLLKQLCYAYEDLLSDMKKGNGSERKRVQQRANEVKKQSLAIRRMIEASHALE